jgi:2-iminobutanoate/2-iminopropanoate deaminase
MRRRSVHVPGLGHGGQPIPNACRIGELLWSGGIAGIDPSTGKIPADVSGEVSHMFANVESIMIEAGGSTDDIIKVSIYTPDRAVILEPLANQLKLQCEIVAVLAGSSPK